MLILAANAAGSRNAEQLLLACPQMPGHGGWHFGMPEITLSPACPTVLDVTKDETYTVLSKFLAELAEIFEDDVLMLGGDEVRSFLERSGFAPVSSS